MLFTITGVLAIAWGGLAVAWAPSPDVASPGRRIAARKKCRALSAAAKLAMALVAVTPPA